MSRAQHKEVTAELGSVLGKVAKRNAAESDVNNIIADLRESFIEDYSVPSPTMSKDKAQEQSDEEEKSSSSEEEEEEEEEAEEEEVAATDDDPLSLNTSVEIGSIGSSLNTSVDTAFGKSDRNPVFTKEDELAYLAFEKQMKNRTIIPHGSLRNINANNSNNTLGNSNSGSLPASSYTASSIPANATTTTTTTTTTTSNNDVVPPPNGRSSLRDNLRHAPTLMFGGANKGSGGSKIEETPTSPKNKIETYMEEEPSNVVSGMARGLLSVGNGLFKGITGIVMDPYKGAQQEGAVGFMKGVGKGLTGVVIRPVAGIVDFVGKTAHGVINTPMTIYEAFSGSEEDAELHKMVMSEDTRKMFGIPLEESIRNAERLGIPHIFYECIDYVARHVDTEGIFRISGSLKYVNAIRNACDQGRRVTFKVEDERFGPHEISGVLKLFLRELPNPLLTFERYQQFIDTKSIEDPELRLQKYIELVASLPELNRRMLRELFRLLALIAAHSEKNFMPVNNLATVFGPSLLRADLPGSVLSPRSGPGSVGPNAGNKMMASPEHQQRILLEVGQGIGVMHELIDANEKLFADENYSLAPLPQ